MYLTFIYLFLATVGLCCYTWAFSSCSKQGLLSSCGARASHCGGFSCCGAQALGHVGSVVVGCTGLVALWHVKFSQTRGRTHVPCIGRRILNHWATTEVQRELF